MKQNKNKNVNKMYNLVSCYDTLELKSRGDVLSDKVYMSDTGEGEGEMLRISQSESILTDMTHVISPMSAKSPLSSRSRGSPLQPHQSNGGPNCNGLSKANGKGSRHVSYSAAEPEEFQIPISVNNSGPSWPGPASELGLDKEVEPEPYCFPVFRWSLILVGLAMLICVFVVLVQLLVDWGRS